MELVLDIEKRRAKHKSFDTELAQLLSSRIYFYQQTKVACADQAYLIWKSVIESCYGTRLKINQPLFQFRNSNLWKNGFQFLGNYISPDIISQLRKLLLLENHSIKHQISTLDMLNLDDNLCIELVKLIKDVLVKWNNDFIPKGLYALPWRIHLYSSSPDMLSESVSWHYDINVPDNIAFLMLNLNSSDGGTSFLTSHQSATLSMNTDYISTPTNYRAKDLDIFSASQKEYHCKSSSGALVSFMPGRTLHKGIFGNVRRDNLHISVVLISEETKVPFKGKLTTLKMTCIEDILEYHIRGSFTSAANIVDCPYMVNDH